MSTCLYSPQQAILKRCHPEDPASEYGAHHIHFVAPFRPEQKTRPSRHTRVEPMLDSLKTPKETHGAMNAPFSESLEASLSLGFNQATFRWLRLFRASAVQGRAHFVRIILGNAACHGIYVELDGDNLNSNRVFADESYCRSMPLHALHLTSKYLYPNPRSLCGACVAESQNQPKRVLGPAGFAFGLPDLGHHKTWHGSMARLLRLWHPTCVHQDQYEQSADVALVAVHTTERGPSGTRMNTGAILISTLPN